MLLDGMRERHTHSLRPSGLHRPIRTNKAAEAMVLCAQIGSFWSVEAGFCPAWTFMM